MKKKYLYFLLIALMSINKVFALKELTLEDCKNFAVKNNTILKNSNLEIEGSQQVEKSAFTNYFPSISAGGLIWNAQKSLLEMEMQGGNLPVYDGNPANLSKATQFAYFPSSTIGLMQKGIIGYINAVQPIFTGGRIYYGNNLASLGKDVSVLKGRLTEDEILSKTEEQYWQIVTLEEKMKTVKKYEEFLNRLLLQVEDAYKSGLILQNDVLKVKLKISELLLNKSKLDNGKKLALMAFCQYIGIPYDSTLTLNEELKIDDLPQSLYIDKNEALKKRTEYMLLEKSVKAEKLQTNLKFGEYLPQVTIGINETYLKFDENNGRTIGMLYGTVSIPISNWWGGSYELQERKIKEEIAENNLKNNSELLVLQIEKAWQDLIDAYDQYLLSKQTCEQANDNLAQVEDSYKHGVIKVSDLLEAQALNQQAEQQLIEAKAGYFVKQSVYLKATGR